MNTIWKDHKKEIVTIVVVAILLTKAYNMGYRDALKDAVAFVKSVA